MTPENFTYWLQGFFELTDSMTLTPDQTTMVREHLALVFTKVTSKEASGGDEYQWKEVSKDTKIGPLPSFPFPLSNSLPLSPLGGYYCSSDDRIC